MGVQLIHMSPNLVFKFVYFDNRSVHGFHVFNETPLEVILNNWVIGIRYAIYITSNFLRIECIVFYERGIIINGSGQRVIEGRLILLKFVHIIG